MTSQEINFSTVSTEINWLREIAYQLAKQVEQHSEVIQLLRIQVSRMNSSSLADPQPGKRGAESEPGTAEMGGNNGPLENAYWNGYFTQSQEMDKLQGELDAANQHVKILQEQRSQRATDPAEALAPAEPGEYIVWIRHNDQPAKWKLRDDGNRLWGTLLEKPPGGMRNVPEVNVEMLVTEWKHTAWNNIGFFATDIMEALLGQLSQRSQPADPATEAGSQTKEFFTPDRRPGDPGGHPADCDCPSCRFDRNRV